HAHRVASPVRAGRGRVQLSRVGVRRDGHHALPPPGRPRPAAGTRTAASSAGTLSGRVQPAGSHGIVILTVVPTPRALDTAIVPPFNSTLRFAIVRPRPVPVALVEKYGSKIFASACA